MDGKAHSLTLTGTLPEGATVTWKGNGKRAAGAYAVTATVTLGNASVTLGATMYLADLDKVVDGAIYLDLYQKVLYAPDPYHGDEEYFVPQGTEYIFAAAFSQNDMIKKVYLPDSVTDIGEKALGFIATEDGLEKQQGFTVYGTSAAAKSYCEKHRLTHRTDYELLSVSSADDLVVKDGLVGWYDSRDLVGNLGKATSWKNRVSGGDAATILGGVYSAENPTGWRMDGDALYYRTPTVPVFEANKNNVGIVLPSAPFTGLGNFTVETLFDPLGITDDTGKEDIHGNNTSDKSYNQWGAYAGKRSTFTFGGLQLCFFHRSKAGNGNSLNARFFYARVAWEETDPISKKTGMTGARGRDYAIFSADANRENGLASGILTLTFERTVKTGQSTVMDFTVKTPFYTYTHNTSESEPRTVYEGNTLVHPGEAFFGFPAKIYHIRVYDRILTEAEKAQNHFADLCRVFDLDTSLLRSISDGKLTSICNAMASYTAASPKSEVESAFLSATATTRLAKLTVICVDANGNELKRETHHLPLDTEYSVQAPVLGGRYTRTFTLTGNLSGHAERTVLYRIAPALTEAEQAALIPAVTVWGGTLTFGTGSADITAATDWGVSLPALGSTPYGGKYSIVLSNLLASRAARTSVNSLGVRYEDARTVASRMGVPLYALTLSSDVSLTKGKEVALPIAALPEGMRGVLRFGEDKCINPVTVSAVGQNGAKVTVTGTLRVSGNSADTGGLTWYFTPTDCNGTVTAKAGTALSFYSARAYTSGWWIVTLEDSDASLSDTDLFRVIDGIRTAKGNDGKVLFLCFFNDAARVKTLMDRYGDIILPMVEYLSSPATLRAAGLDPAIFLAGGSIPSVLTANGSLNAVGHALVARCISEALYAHGYFDGVYAAYDAYYEEHS